MAQRISAFPSSLHKPYLKWPWHALSPGAHEEFASELRQCGSCGSLAQGKRLHAQLTRRGLDRNTFLGNLLVQMYGKCGSVEDAQTAFQKIQLPNLHTANIMLNALLQNGHVQEAKQIFDEMLPKNLVSWNSMIAAYARCGQLPEAQQVFNKIPWLDPVSCSHLIHGYVKFGQIDEAGRVFEAIVHPDLFICHTMLAAFAVKGHLAAVKNLFDGLGAGDVLTWTTMLQAYDQNGSIEDSERVFDRMPCWNVVAWTSMMSAYVRRGLIEAAVMIFNQMPERDAVTWNVLLGALASNPKELDAATSNFQRMPMHNVISWTTMLAAYSQRGEVSLGKELFDAMPERNLVSWNSMLNAYGQNGRSREALKLFATMDLQGLKQENFTFSAVLDACSSSISLTQGRLIHAEAQGIALDQDLLVGTAVVNMYGKCGQIEEARTTFDKLPVKDIVTWTALFAAYASSGNARAVLELFPRLELEGTRSDGVTLLSVLAACSHAGRLNDGRCCFLSLVPDYEVVPTVDHYGCMVDSLGRGGQLEDAEDLINSMPFEADCVTWSILLRACRLHNDVKRGQRAAKWILELESGNSGALVQLLSIYEEAGGSS